MTHTYVNRIRKFSSILPSKEEQRLIQQTTFRNPNAVVEDIILEDKPSGLGASIVISHDKQRISVVFRGCTSGVQLFDWTTKSIDFESLSSGRDVARQRPLRAGIKVRRDLIRKLCSSGAFEAVRKAVMKELLQNAGYDLLVTGHGPAAAISTLFGFLLSREVPSFVKVTVIAFGSTSVGNRRWRKACREQSNLTILRVHQGKGLSLCSLKHVGTDMNIKGCKDCDSVCPLKSLSSGTRSRQTYCQNFVSID